MQTVLRNQSIFWAVVAGMLFWLLWSLSDVLMPFTLGLAVAYLLDPLVVKLEKQGLSRLLATILILSCFFLLLSLALILTLPALYRETLQLAEDLPDLVEKIWSSVAPFINRYTGTDMFEINLVETLRENASSALSVSSNVLAGLLSGGQAFIGFLSVIIITPLVAFFTMTNWPKVTGSVEDLIPRQHYETVMSLLVRINRSVSGFVRGQITVAIILGLIYAIALSIVGLDYGFIIGMAAGLLSIIPFLGSIVGLLVSLLMAWFQSGELGFMGIVAAIFIIGQLLEGNVISPKVLGKSVGLHPFWILFSVTIGGSLFGITGMILGVPIASTTGVLLGFALQKYRESEYYGEDSVAEEESGSSEPGHDQGKATVQNNNKSDI